MLTVLVLMMALALTLGAWLGLQLMGQQGRILLRLGAVEQHLATARSANDRDPDHRAGLPVGIAAPGFELPDMQGNAVTLQSFKGKRVLLIFFDPACGFCARMAGDVAALPVHGEGGSPVPVIITTGAAAKNQAWFTTRGIRCPVLLQPGHAVAAAYRASGTPVGYVIDARGRIASGLALGSDALLALAAAPPAVHPAMATITRSLGESQIERNGLAPGTPAPDFFRYAAHPTMRLWTLCAVLLITRLATLYAVHLAEPVAVS